MEPVAIIVGCLIFGTIAAAIAQAKNLPVNRSFLLGALLGIIGIVIVICQKRGLPTAPPGMRAVKCARCNTIQNVPLIEPVYECWQCKAIHRLWRDPEPEQTKPMDEMGRQPELINPMSKVKCHKCQHVQAVPLGLAVFGCLECGTRLKRRTAPA